MSSGCWIKVCLGVNHRSCDNGGIAARIAGRCVHLSKAQLRLVRRLAKLNADVYNGPRSCFAPGWDKESALAMTVINVADTPIPGCVSQILPTTTFLCISIMLTSLIVTSPSGSNLSAWKNVPISARNTISQRENVGQLSSFN